MNILFKIAIISVIFILAFITFLTIFSLNSPLKSFIVQSGSMRPNITEGSIVFVNRSFDNLRIGDVIVFKNPNNPRFNITHRIFKITQKNNNEVFKTKGDANRSADPWLIKNQAIWGKVILSIPWLGYIVNFAKTKTGVIFIVVLPLLIIAYDEVKIITREFRKLRKKKKKFIPKTPLILLLFLIIFPTPIFAGFNDQVSLTNYQISTGYWSDFTSPIATLAVSDSWTKTIEEKINFNSGFENGTLAGWDYAGQVEVLDVDSIENPETTIIPYEDNYMVRIGAPVDPGNLVWENRLMKSIDTGAKSISLFYRYLSRDMTGFDDPGFFIRLNDQEVFRRTDLNSDGVEAQDTGWTQFYYDLTGQNNSKFNLSIYAGNTSDRMAQSWAYIDSITTNFSVAPPSAEYSLTATDNESGVNNIKYKLYQEGDAEPDDWTIYDWPFSIIAPGEYNLRYRVQDNANNFQDYYTKLIVDGATPSRVTDLSIDESGTGTNTLVLNWSAPGNDDVSGKASTYDIRYQKNCNDPNDFNFETAIRMQNLPAPKESLSLETIVVSGLDASTDYCFGLKTADEAPNWSDLSNIAISETLGGPAVNYGDIVINELMYAGSSISENDEWLELRNLTDHNIDLTGFYLSKLDNGIESLMPIDLTGSTIDANSYFLIAKSNDFGGLDSALGVMPDIWDNDLDLSNSSLQIKFYTDTDALIDTAWDGSAPTEGLYDSVNHKYYSMERVSNPGEGSNPLNWYTCIDGSSTNDYFDSEGNDRGTPRTPNRSVNEPLGEQIILERIFIPTPIILPEIIINLSEVKTNITFDVKNIKDFVKITFELTYDSDSGLQGITGQTDLNNQEEYIQNNLILGTCSTGGTCIYHTGIKNIKLKIELEDVKGEIMDLEKLIE